jgi:hypothetical protein
MKTTAVVLGLALASEPVASEPVPTEPVPVRPQPAPSPGERTPGDRMVQAGVGVVVLGIAAYGLMAVGLGIGSGAESDLPSLGERGDIEARREVMARGRLGNRLAIAGTVTATVAMAVGIPLIVLGRRRHEAASPRATVMVSGGATGLGLRVTGRF